MAWEPPTMTAPVEGLVPVTRRRKMKDVIHAGFPIYPVFR